MIASDIMTDAATLLLDPGNGHWSQSELLGYVSEAQRAVISLRPEANTITEDLPLDQGVSQSLPKIGMYLVDIPRNVAGPSIRAVDQRTLDHALPGWAQTDASNVIQHYMYDGRNPTRFSVYPPADAGSAVIVVYVATVADLSARTDVLALPEQYRAPILDYVLFRAHSKDTEAAFPARAQAHYQMFVQMLGLQKQVDAAEIAGEPDSSNPRELR